MKIYDELEFLKHQLALICRAIYIIDALEAGIFGDDSYPTCFEQTLPPVAKDCLELMKHSIKKKLKNDYGI